MPVIQFDYASLSSVSEKGRTNVNAYEFWIRAQAVAKAEETSM